MSRQVITVTTSSDSFSDYQTDLSIFMRQESILAYVDSQVIDGGTTAKGPCSIYQTNQSKVPTER